MLRKILKATFNYLKVAKLKYYRHILDVLNEMIPGWHFNNLYLLHFSASTTWTTRVFRPITFTSPPTASPQTSPLTEALPRYSTVSAPTNAPLRIPATALT